jgi:tetratricopeptide (TPR) repeat protein
MTAQALEESRIRLAETGRNDVCPCGSGKKYKKCHLRQDEEATAAPVEMPNAKTMVKEAWKLFEQRRPGAAEKKFLAALELDGNDLDARVGLGMAKLSGGDTPNARAEFETALARGKDLEDALAKEGATNAFDRPEAQSFIRAAHALGCLAYDEKQYEACTASLERVARIDRGAVGTEARLVAAKALMQLGRPTDARPLLEEATKFEPAAGRAQMGLALAHFVAGDRGAASKSLQAALAENQHMAEAVLGRIRRRVDHPAAAVPGSKEEAVVYAQAFGDVWTDAAKDFLKESLSAPVENAEAGQSASA